MRVRHILEQLDFFFPSFRDVSEKKPEMLQIGSLAVPLRFVRNDSARRYILRVADDGSARVTVPRRGSLKAAREFVSRHLGWIEQELQKNPIPARPAAWEDGTEILFRGETARLLLDRAGQAVRFADQSISLRKGHSGDLRSIIEKHLRKLAMRELVPRTYQLAVLHQLSIGKVVVRNQRSRWGSCSVKKTICLNWRLIQTPPFVSDYIILHELMHLREMNHSRRFWALVEQVCRDYRVAERWLKKQGPLLK